MWLRRDLCAVCTLPQSLKEKQRHREMRAGALLPEPTRERALLGPEPVSAPLLSSPRVPLFAQCTTYAPARGPLSWLFLLPGAPFTQAAPPQDSARPRPGRRSGVCSKTPCEKVLSRPLTHVVSVTSLPAQPLTLIYFPSFPFLRCASTAGV